MNKIEQLNRAKALLQQAMTAATAAMPNNHAVTEARSHMRRAISELDNAAKTQDKRQTANETGAKKWWGQIVSGVANQPVTQEAANKSLAALNAMMSVEEKKLADLQAEAEKPTAADQLFRD
jgi:hypothetical protein